LTARRVTLSPDPIPGYGEGRPLPDPGRPEGEARAELRRAWAACFLEAPEALSAAGRLVLEDLARQCHGGATTAKADGQGRGDAIASAVAEGRRQVLLLILARLGLNKGLVIL
jgi:hypothetical protein